MGAAAMTGEERRSHILGYISDSKKPVSATALAGQHNVSRQVIVQDIALIRAAGNNIISTNRGYILDKPLRCRKIFKVRHRDDEILEELYGIVDLGGEVIDVFVNHKAYGQVRAELNINSRRKAEALMEQIKSGKSSPLKNITSDYHYHTVTADSGDILEVIEQRLRQQGFLVV